MDWNIFVPDVSRVSRYGSIWHIRILSNRLGRSIHAGHVEVA